MKRLHALAAALLLFAASAVAAPQAHMVFFSLADATDANLQKMVKACHKHLADHEGVVYFSVGVRAKKLARDVNDKSFDVALHMVFDGRASHDAYQTSPQHLAFIDEALPLVARVRVFDSDLVEAAAPAEPAEKAPVAAE